jgi:outer membrane protein
LSLCFIPVLGPGNCLADDATEWFARVGGLGAIYHSSATVSTPEGAIPGATATVSNNFTGILELGYDVTQTTYVLLMAGIPPEPKISAAGSIASVGELGSVTYGPAVLTAGYRVPVSGKLQAYVGAGVAYAIILRNHDAAVSNLQVHNNFGFALQAGAEYELTEKLGVFLDARQLWLSVNADGMLSGAVPVHARVTLNPTLVSVGVKFRF